MVSGLLSSFIEEGRPASILEYLDSTPYDELIEVDLKSDQCQSLYHVEGKYFVPVTDGSFTSLYEYFVDNILYRDDRDVFVRFMNPSDIRRRLAESVIPGAVTMQYRCKMQDGSWRWVEQCIIGDGRQGLPEGVVRFYVFDIENQKRREAGERSSQHFVVSSDLDERTGLLNERSFLARLTGAIMAGRTGQWCLVAIDIDHLKLYNEWYGREAGDCLLGAFGVRLAEEAEETGGLAGYFSKDDFCVFMPYERDRISKLFDDLSELISASGAAVGFTPIFGISPIEGPQTGFELVDQAVIAAANAKADFRKNICVFRAPMREQTDREFRILSDFHYGLENGEIYFQMQPQCRISTGKIVGAEALARWRRADGSFVSPFDFVPVLEEHGFITNLDRFIWEEVCKWLRSWIDGGHTPIPVSVNVSQVDFYMLDVPEYFGWLIEKYDLDPALLKVEITESAYMNNVAVIKEATEQLRAKGFFVLMDDFGSGYSSLNTLRNFSIDIIKLDAQFLHFGDDTKRKGVHILESVINMAKSLSLPIICEGVESDELSSFLDSQGCRYVQGYNFYSPLDVKVFEETIADGQVVDTRGLVPKFSEQLRTRELFDEYVYSDSMLNSILGPVVLCSWHGDDVDVVRFNEEFYELINSEDLHQLLKRIQNVMTPDSRQELFRLLAAAEKNELNGASGVLSIQRYSGAINRYLCRFYYLGTKDDGKLFYVAARDVTELTELQSDMRLISRFSSDTIVFVRQRERGVEYSIIVHGLEDAMGLSADELKEELASDRFIERMDEESAQAIRDYLVSDYSKSPVFRFRFTNTRGETIDMDVKSDAVVDDSSDVVGIMEFRAV